MATYSFLDVNATLDGPGASISMGHGASTAEQGITISYSDDRNNMTIGSDGEVMHTLRADKSGTVTVRLQKTSPINAQLNAVFTAQSVAPELWGQNVITITNPRVGDLWACRDVAFSRVPDTNYAQDGDTMEWEFQAGKIDPILGTY